MIIVWTKKYMLRSVAHCRRINGSVKFAYELTEAV